MDFLKFPLAALNLLNTSVPQEDITAYAQKAIYIYIYTLLSLIKLKSKRVRQVPYLASREVNYIVLELQPKPTKLYQF